MTKNTIFIYSCVLEKGDLLNKKKERGYKNRKYIENIQKKKYNL